MISGKRKIRKKLTDEQLANFQMDSGTAEALAQPFRMTDGGSIVDPLDVAPSLLSADHIIEYVNQTGMVAPFDSMKGKKSRLKAASYEGRIGKNAYIFEKGNSAPQPALEDGAKKLKVRANSIVFVESDLDFRLPPFIAIRFNLQINHVHRGLLLGTGPLVDPGFWGKLCIPLHNLTNEDYEIPLEEGLFWVEFTKTTSVPLAGRPPSNTGFWDIRKFISKASQPSDLTKPAIPILSSIPDMVDEANSKSEQAAKDARTASENSEKMRTWSGVGLVVGGATVVGLAVTVAGLAWSYQSSLGSVIDNFKPEVQQIDSKIERHLELLSTDGATKNGSNEQSAKFIQSIESLRRENLQLRDELEAQKVITAEQGSSINALKSNVK